MKAVVLLWKKITRGKAVDDAGPLEKKFFEIVYRLSYATGLSYADHGIRYNIFRALYWGMSLLHDASEIWYACCDALTLDDLIMTINVIIIRCITYWKLGTMLKNKEMFKKLAKALESPYLDTSTTKRMDLVDYWAKTHKMFLIILLIGCFSTLLIWNTFPLVDDVEYNFMTGMHIPFNYRTTLRYTIAYIIVGIMFNTASYLPIMSEVNVQAYLLPLICQYTVLADCFENIFDDCAKEFEGVETDDLVNNKLFIDKYKTRLGNLVKQHLSIINHTLDLKAILSAPMLGQLCCSGMLICLIGYQSIATMSENPGKFIMSVGYLVYNMFTLYLLCRWCEEITTQGQRIGEAAYCSGWENGISQVHGVKATIMLIMVRANKPMIFLAGGMYTLNLSSYTDLVKASYSALNILLRMSNEP